MCDVDMSHAHVHIVAYHYPSLFSCSFSTIPICTFLIQTYSKRCCSKTPIDHALTAMGEATHIHQIKASTYTTEPDSFINV